MRPIAALACVACADRLHVRACIAFTSSAGAIVGEVAAGGRQRRVPELRLDGVHPRLHKKVAAGRMRILANENVPGPVVAALRAAGHDVLWVKESMTGAKDHDVHAQSEARLVVTFDKDFGELAVRSRLPAASGVVLFRLHGSGPGVDTPEPSRRSQVVTIGPGTSRS